MIRDLVVGYAPLWFLLGAIAVAAGVEWAGRRWDRRVSRARRSLSELEARAAVRPSPASIDVEPMR